MMLEYARDNGGIGLTKSGALNRTFLAWAVEAFDWPGYEPAEVYAVNKVVNEIDYLPGWYRRAGLRLGLRQGARLSLGRGRELCLGLVWRWGYRVGYRRRAGKASVAVGAAGHCRCQQPTPHSPRF